MQDFYFSDLRAGGTKRAGDVTVEKFEKTLTPELALLSFFQLNTAVGSCDIAGSGIHAPRLGGP